MQCGGSEGHPNEWRRSKISYRSENNGCDVVIYSRRILTLRATTWGGSLVLTGLKGRRWRARQDRAEQIKQKLYSAYLGQTPLPLPLARAVDTATWLIDLTRITDHPNAEETSIGIKIEEFLLQYRKKYEQQWNMRKCTEISEPNVS